MTASYQICTVVLPSDEWWPSCRDIRSISSPVLKTISTPLLCSSNRQADAIGKYVIADRSPPVGSDELAL
jgi:hypothetical protein